MNRSALRSIITPMAIARLVLGWLGVILLTALHSLLEPPVPAATLIIVLVAVVAVILFASFGVVHEAEALAHRLGDPYGSLVLTLSVVIIEVVLIAAVMLGPGEHATIARDSVTAVMMIILNLVVGSCVLVGSLKHRHLEHNRVGTGTYLGMISLLVVLAFVLPTVAGRQGGYSKAQEIPIIVITVALYAWFLIRQMGPQAADYHEVDIRLDSVGDTAPRRRPIGEVIRHHRGELLVRLALLVATMLPIVLMSHHLADLLNDGLGRAGAPIALAGMLIALIVFTPESITAIRAALNGELQRVINLCHGAFVSTVGLTIPSVLVIGMITDQRVVLAESAGMLALIVATVALSAISFAQRRVNATHGAMQLALFGVYLVVLFTT